MPKQLLNNQLIRFFIVGGVNTVFGYSVFAFLIYLGLHYSIAALAGTFIGVLFNFKTTGKLVFKNSDNTLIIRFFAVYGIVYLLNVTGLAFFNHIQINNYVAGAILIVPVGVIAFLLNKKFVFNKSKPLNNTPKDTGIQG